MCEWGNEDWDTFMNKGMRWNRTKEIENRTWDTKEFEMIVDILFPAPNAQMVFQMNSNKLLDKVVLENRKRAKASYLILLS